MRWRACLIVAVFLGLAARAESQTSPLIPSAAAEEAARGLSEGNTDLVAPSIVPGAVDPDSYIVGPGDVFQLHYAGRLTRSITLVVGPEGTVFLPGGGTTKLDGLTLRSARTLLIQKSMQGLRGVTVDVRLIRVRMMRVYVTGEVRHSGSLEIPAWSRASEILPESLTTERASRRNVTILRAGHGANGQGAPIVADLVRFDRSGDARFDPHLSDGDVVQVPVANRFVEIAGAVGRPGTFELGPSDSLRTLLDLAGGPLPSAQERCLLVRWTSATTAESSQFDLADVLSGRQDLALRDGDHVFAYFTARFHELEEATIVGEVKRPGPYPLVTNRTRLSDLVTAAGGFLDRADMSTIRVFRASRGAEEPDPEIERLSRLSRAEMTSSEYEVLRARLTARREDYRVDWNSLKQSPELDLLLRNGDIVRVDPVFAAIRVEGEVRHPGLIQYQDGRSIHDYVELAGGYSERAARTKVRVTRSVTGQTLLSRDVSEIAPGDLIWVPERPDITGWQHLQTLIAVAAQVATVIIAVRR